MSLRGLLLLLIVAVLLAIALARLRGPGKEEAPPVEDAPVLAPFEPEKVRAILTACGETSYELRRGPASGWRLVAPASAEADPREIRSLLEALRGARVRKVVATGASDLGAFGLGPDACTVRLEMEGDAAGRHLAIGRSSPVGYERYARGADGRVLLVDGGIHTAVAKSPEAIEERRLLPFEAASVTRLEIERPDGRIVLARDGEAWRLEEPVRDIADSFEAERAVRAATELELERGTKASPPAVSLRDRRLALRAGGRTALVAAAGVGGKRLAWREGETVAGLVRESDLIDLQRPASALRDRQVLNFSSPDARRVVVSRGGTTLTLARASEDAPWTATEGGAPPVPVDVARVQSLLDRIRSARAVGILEGQAPSPPTGTVAVEGASGEIGRATWGPLPPEAGEERVWVTTPARPGVVFLVAASAFGPMPARAADLSAP